MVDIKVLIVDRDRDACQAAEDGLTQTGHSFHTEAIKEMALQAHNEAQYNVVFLDPSPQPEARPFIIGLRRSSGQQGRYTYVAVASRDKTREDVLKSGGNEVLGKPFSKKSIQRTLENAQRFLTLYHDLKSTEEEDIIRGQGAMIGRAAITQIFLTAVDRADRYGEKSYMMNITIDNFNEIKASHGEEKANNLLYFFIKNLKQVRRRSDMLGRLAENHFTLIMQRPVNDQEPVDATTRMAQSITQFLRNEEFQGINLKISLDTMSIPIGEIVAEHAAS